MTPFVPAIKKTSPHPHPCRGCIIVVPKSWVIESASSRQARPRRFDRQSDLVRKVTRFESGMRWRLRLMWICSQRSPRRPQYLELLRQVDHLRDTPTRTQGRLNLRPTLRRDSGAGLEKRAILQGSNSANGIVRWAGSVAGISPKQPVIAWVSTGKRPSLSCGDDSVTKPSLLDSRNERVNPHARNHNIQREGH